MRRSPRNQEGFTLIELMVVVLIIGILVAIALPTFLGARTRAQDSAAKARLKTALTGAKAYFNGDGRGSYTGFAAAGVPEAEETGTGWVYPSAPAVVGRVTINWAEGDLLVISSGSSSGSAFCIASSESSVGVPGSIGPQTLVRGRVDANGQADYTVDAGCTSQAW